MKVGIRTTYTLEGFDGRVYVRVWKKRYAKAMVRNEYDIATYGLPNEGICYKVKRNGQKKFCFIW